MILALVLSMKFKIKDTKRTNPPEASLCRQLSHHHPGRRAVKDKFCPQGVGGAASLGPLTGAFARMSSMGPTF